MSQLATSHAQDWEMGTTSWDFIGLVQFLEGRSDKEAILRIRII